MCEEQQQMCAQSVAVLNCRCEGQRNISWCNGTEETRLSSPSRLFIPSTFIWRIDSFFFFFWHHLSKRYKCKICRLYSLQSSSICRAALHAGVIKASGGYLDILAMDKKNSYTGSLKNGVQSERYLLLVHSSELFISECVK